MAADYREIDLQSNRFLLQLQSAQSPLAPFYAQVSTKGGMVLIPPPSCIPKTIDATFAKQHLLLPRHIEKSPQNNSTAAQASDASVESATKDSDANTDASANEESEHPSPSRTVSLWINLLDQLVQITDGMIYLPADGTGEPRARIKLEELFYDDDFNAFHCVCLDNTMASDTSGKNMLNKRGSINAASRALPAPTPSVSVTAYLTGSTTRPELRSLSAHRDVLTRVLGELIATKCIFASHSLDFFLTDFSLAWLGVVTRQPEKAAEHLRKASARCLSESIASVKEHKKHPPSTSNAQNQHGGTGGAGGGGSHGLNASVKSFASWPQQVFQELELGISCHILSCLHSKIFGALSKTTEAKTKQEQFHRARLELGEKVSLFDVGIEAHLVGLCDPRPAIELLKSLGTFVTPLERLATLQKVEMALLESMNQSVKERRAAHSMASSTTPHENHASTAPTNDPSTVTSNPSSTVASPRGGPTVSSSSSSSTKPLSIPPVAILPAAMRGGLFGVAGTTSASRKSSVSSSASRPRTNSNVCTGGSGENTPSSSDPHAPSTPAARSRAGSVAAPSPCPSPTDPVSPALQSAHSATAGSSTSASQVAASILAAAAQSKPPTSGLASPRNSITAGATLASQPPNGPPVSTMDSPPPSAASVVSNDPAHSVSPAVWIPASPLSSSVSSTSSNATLPRRKSSSTGPIGISADDLLPLLVYVILEAAPVQPYATVAYCKNFAPSPTLLTPSVHSELMYRLANFEAALEYISSGRLREQMTSSASQASASNTASLQAGGGKKPPRIRMSSISVASTQTLHALLTPVSKHHRNLFPRPQELQHAHSASASMSSSVSGANGHVSTDPSMPSLLESPHTPPGAASSTLAPIGSLDSTADESMYADDIVGMDDSEEEFGVHGQDTNGDVLPDGIASEGEVDFSDSVFTRSAHRLRSIQSAEPLNGANGLARATSSNSLFGAPLMDGVETTSDNATSLPAWLTDEANDKPSRTKRSTGSDATIDVMRTATGQTPASPHAASSSTSDDPPRPVLASPLIPLRTTLDEEDPLGALTKRKKPVNNE